MINSSQSLVRYAATIAIIASVLVLFSGCNSNIEDNQKTSPTPMASATDVTEDGETNIESDTTVRATFESELQEQYSNIQSGIAIAQNQLDEIGASVSTESQQAMATLKAQQEDFEADYEDFKSASADKWEAARAQVSASFNALVESTQLTMQTIQNNYDAVQSGNTVDASPEAATEAEATAEVELSTEAEVDGNPDTEPTTSPVVAE